MLVINLEICALLNAIAKCLLLLNNAGKLTTPLIFILPKLFTNLTLYSNLKKAFHIRKNHNNVVNFDFDITPTLNCWKSYNKYNFS